jgi:hypothetical protein
MDWIAPLEKEAAHDTLEIAFGEFVNPSFADPNRQISASKNRPGIFWLLCFCFVSWLQPLGHLAAAPILPEMAGSLAAHEEGFWRSCAKPSDSVTSRQLFAYALVLCEARQHPDRLDQLFALAEQMQDRDPQSRGYGNFWWAMRDKKVMDYNAVDFSMRGGALLWLKHRDFIPAPARQRLEKLLEFSIQGCLRHKVQPAYSNIAIMNAGDLILLGEAMGRPEVAAEGYARLDQVFRYTQAAGIHEFDSPTYTGVDLDGLGMIEAFCRRDAGRIQARSLLELFWTDIALNWFPPAQKLAGAHSRTYDFLHGLGELDRQLALNGWLAAPAATDIDTIYSLQANWHPPQKNHELSNQFPRLVRQSWGNDWWQSRTHFLLPDITLSSTASSYGGRMDMPLTVDVPGDRNSVRGYFVADGRDDPYGGKKIADGSHQKAFHLNPFWTAAQRNGDAAGLVIYRPKDIPAEATTLVSDFVMPLDADSFWIGERRVEFPKDQPCRLPVKPGEVVAFRKGGAAFALRVPWSRGLDGKRAPSDLIHDGNSVGAVRLAVEHVGPGQKPEFSGNHPGAAFWLRAASGIKTDEEFLQWVRRFASADASVEAKPDGIQLKMAGLDGPVAMTASAPWSAPKLLEPMPTRCVLELNGEDIGHKILLPQSQLEHDTN